MTISPISTAPVVRSPGNYSASSDQVIAIFGAVTTATFNYSGSSNFIVHAITASQETLVANEIGTFNGNEIIPVGTLYLIVEAEGPWSVTLG